MRDHIQPCQTRMELMMLIGTSAEGMAPGLHLMCLVSLQYVADVAYAAVLRRTASGKPAWSQITGGYEAYDSPKIHAEHVS